MNYTSFLGFWHVTRSLFWIFLCTKSPNYLPPGPANGWVICTFSLLTSTPDQYFSLSNHQSLFNGPIIRMSFCSIHVCMQTLEILWKPIVVPSNGGKSYSSLLNIIQNSHTIVPANFEHMSTFLHHLLPSCIKWLHIDKKSITHQHIMYIKPGLGEVQWGKTRPEITTDLKANITLIT